MFTKIFGTGQKKNIFNKRIGDPGTTANKK